MKKDPADQIVKSILSKATVHQAPGDLNQRIFDAWKAENRAVVEHPALIPSGVWWFLGLAMAALVAWKLFQPASRSNVELPAYLNWLKAHAELPSLSLNPVVAMALIASATLLLVNLWIVSKKIEKELVKA